MSGLRSIAAHTAPHSPERVQGRDDAAAAAAPVPAPTAPSLGAVPRVAEAGSQAASPARRVSAQAPPETLPRQAGQHSAFVPLLLGGLALLAWFGVQTWLLLDERTALQATHAAQQHTVDRAAKLRQSLDAIAADTQRLSDSGSSSARVLIDDLRRRGITINAAAAPTTPAAAAAKN